MIKFTEEQTQIFLSKELKKMKNGALENILRTILFSSDNKINWDKARESIMLQYSEI